MVEVCARNGITDSNAGATIATPSDRPNFWTSMVSMPSRHGNRTILEWNVLDKRCSRNWRLRDNREEMSTATGNGDRDGYETESKKIAVGIRALVEAGRSSHEGRNLPDAASIGMQHLGKQTLFPQRPGQDRQEGLIDVCVGNASVSLFSGESHLLAIADLLESETEPFVWTLPVVARAALESFAVVRHLMEDGVSFEAREGRAMNELVHSARQMNKLSSELGGSPVRLAHRLEQGDRMGLRRYTDRKGNAKEWFVETRPGSTELVNALLKEGLGKAVYSKWSAVAHSLSWGVYQQVAARKIDSVTGQMFGMVTATTRNDALLAQVVSHAHHECLMHFLQWHGWPIAKYNEVFFALMKAWKIPE